MSEQRQLFIMVGPSGVGKNSIVRKILDSLPNIFQMPTATTRLPRPDELNGREHYFFSEQEFSQLIAQGELIEWQQVHGNLYGAMKSVLLKGFDSDNDFIADLEVLGAQTIKKLFLDNVILIFLIPPTLEDLENRIRERGSITEEEISIRLSRVRLEMSFIPKCDYLVINDNLDWATEQVKSIVLAERCRKHLNNFGIEEYLTERRSRDHEF